MLTSLSVGSVPDEGLSLPVVNVNILRASQQIYHEAKNFISNRPVRVWSRDSCILDALTLSVVSESGIKPLDVHGNFSRPQITIPSFGNAYFRSAITKLQLNLCYWHLAVSDRPLDDVNRQPEWSEEIQKHAANKIFPCFPALREVQILVYGSKGHRILREAKKEDLSNLKRHLCRLVRYIPSGVDITFSDLCPGKTTLRADCIRSLVKEDMGNQLDVSAGTSISSHSLFAYRMCGHTIPHCKMHILPSDHTSVSAMLTCF